LSSFQQSYWCGQGTPTYFISAADQVSGPQVAVLPSAPVFDAPVQGTPTYFISAADQVSGPQAAVLPSADCGAGAGQGTPTYFISAADQVSVPHAGAGAAVCAVAEVIANVAPNNVATAATVAKGSIRIMVYSPCD
jgi:hypothetical protein